jgi:undecaprenyl-diphosphatase
MQWLKLLEIDQRFSSLLRIAERPGVLRTAAALFAHSGDSWFWLIGLGMLWLWGTDYWKLRVVILIKAIIVTAIVVFIVKLLVRRRRPEGEWGGIYRNTDPHSFPSGHAARAVMIAVILIGVGPTWLGGLLLIWAPIVALARVAMGVHYVSDILAGLLIGLSIGLSFIA